MGDARIRSYRDLVAWQRGLDFAVECHQFATALPRAEQYELAAQIRRSASSVPLNIAEGFGLGSGKAFARHLRISRGSTFEAQTGIAIAQRLGLAGPQDRLQELAEETVRLIQGLLRSIRRSSADDSED
jgi:four helix bundle protein